MRTTIFAPRFGDAAQQESYYQWLNGFPEESKRRIDEIDQIPEHDPSHIRLATRYGKEDTFVASLNDEIVGLIKDRRNPDESIVAKATEKLKDLRAAINRVLTEFRA